MAELKPHFESFGGLVDGLHKEDAELSLLASLRPHNGIISKEAGILSIDQHLDELSIKILEWENFVSLEALALDDLEHLQKGISFQDNEIKILKQAVHRKTA
jgi:hypothetical protein